MAEVISSRHLKTFSDHFEAFGNMYVLIGGSAVQLHMEEAGLNARTTKDLDLVLCIEALNYDFVEQFWGFIRLGKYSMINKSTGKKCFYRFTAPQNPNFPYMLEILSDKLDIIEDREPGTIVPMSIDEEAVSLSAILLDKAYYEFIMGLKNKIRNITIADYRVIIPLKARAYLDLILRKERDEHVNSKDIKKHKNDIYRLSQLLVREPLKNTPEKIKNDIESFVNKISDGDETLRALKILNLSIDEIKDTLLLVYASGNS